jgi:hypothetical protein
MSLRSVMYSFQQKSELRFVTDVEGERDRDQDRDQSQ